jgi:Ca2+-binding RTX toxin-like protein
VEILMSTDRNDSIVAGPEGDDRIGLAGGGNAGDVAAGPSASGGTPVPDCNETIIGTEGPDTLYGGKGSDYIDGRGGDDVIYGDSEDPGAPPAAREAFKWSLAPDPDDGGVIDSHDGLSGGFSQDTGSVTVNFSVTQQSPAVHTDYITETEYVGGIDSGGATVDDSSALGSTLNGQGNSAEYALGFSEAVENISFRINDIDADSIVHIRAYDASGNQIPVTLTGGAGMIMIDTDSILGVDTANSTSPDLPPNNPDQSMLVEIAGPVARVVIEHEQGGPANSGINVTDVYFSVWSGDKCEDGDDTLIGGSGDDIIYGEGGDDSIDGGTGDDSLDGGTGDDSITGGDGDDTIIGGDGSDTVDGGTGDDEIDTSGGTNIPDRGYPGSPGSPAVAADPDPNDDRDLVHGGTGDDIIRTGDDADTIFGGDGDDTIDGGIDDDSIEGGTGDDSLIGGDGNDTVDGGDGDDYINTSGRLLHALPDRGFPGYSGPPIVPVIPADPDPDNDRDLVHGGDGNDFIITGDDDDTITGGSGHDTIDAGIDDDSVDGGDGDDLITGGEGSDTISGGAGDDTVYGGLDPIFPDGLNIRDDGEVNPPDPDPGNGRDLIDGGAGNDVLYGQDDDDTITGGEGDDYIDGGIDDDVLSGGAGSDTVIGGQGNDTISGDVGVAGDGVDDLFGGIGDDLFVDIGQGDTVTGGEDPDDLDVDVLDLRGVADRVNPGGRLEVEYDVGDPEAGIVRFFDNAGAETGTTRFSEIENVIPCFTPGTMIATPMGERRVEDLAVGDRVITRDNGIQAIRWVGRRDLTAAEMARASHLRPVRIRAGALGNGLPERDLLVSPNHRILIANEKTSLYFDDREVLVAAKHLIALDGVDVVEVDDLAYIHIMFDQHEVVLSDGAWTESFQPGDQTLAGMDDDQRDEIFELFPDLKTRAGLEGYSAARRSLKKHEAQLLVH